MFTIIYRQYDAMDCGPACLKMIVKYYGKNISLQLLRELCNTSREGSSIQAILNASAKIGLTSSVLKRCIEDGNFMPQIPFLGEMPFSLIAHWNNNHFLVIIKIRNNIVCN
jgi:ATP-binding cassette subfamily B protein